MAPGASSCEETGTGALVNGGDERSLVKLQRSRVRTLGVAGMTFRDAMLYRVDLENWNRNGERFSGGSSDVKLSS